MTKLCPRGKAAAKRKFAVYPSAYANAYASKICAGKIKDPSGKKRKDFRGPKPSKAMGGRIYKAEGGKIPTTQKEKTFAALAAPKNRITFADKIAGATGRQKKKGGGLMEATSRLRAQGLKAGGKVCKLATKGKGRAYGKNS